MRSHCFASSTPRSFSSPMFVADNTAVAAHGCSEKRELSWLVRVIYLRPRPLITSQIIWITTSYALLQLPSRKN